MEEYDDALDSILEHGVTKTNKRTGEKTLSVCGIQSRYPLNLNAFPVITRRMYWPKSIFAELLWFISGSTNNNDLKALGSNIWTPWESREFEQGHRYIQGSLGPIYGFQLRHFGGAYVNGDTTNSFYGRNGFDQLQYILDLLKSDPSDRGILFSLWNPKDLDEMRLRPCHYTYQVLVDDEGNLTGHLTQRSCDFPVGVPANIQFYSAFTIMLAQQCGFTPYEFIHEAVDAHIYWNQIDAVKQYLETPIVESPRLMLNKAPSMYEYKLDDFVLEGYLPGPKINIPVTV